MNEDTDNRQQCVVVRSRSTEHHSLSPKPHHYLSHHVSPTNPADPAMPAPAILATSSTTTITTIHVKKDVPVAGGAPSAGPVQYTQPPLCHCCGRTMGWFPLVIAMFGLGLCLQIVAHAFTNFLPHAEEREHSFITDANTKYVGWKGLLLFFALLLLVCIPTSYALYRIHDLETYGFFHLLGPTSAGLATQAIFADMESAYWGPPRGMVADEWSWGWYVFGVMYPIVFLLLAHLPYWCSQPEALDAPLLQKTWRMFYNCAFCVSVGKFTFSGLLEEMGWSLFLFPQLFHAFDGRYTAASVLAGLIWGTWHVPLVFWGGYNYNLHRGWASLMMIFLAITWSFTYMFIRVWSWSIWPVVVSHITHNVVLEMFCNPLSGRCEYLPHGQQESERTRDLKVFYWVGEFGVLSVLSYQFGGMIMMLFLALVCLQYIPY